MSLLSARYQVRSDEAWLNWESDAAKEYERRRHAGEYRWRMPAPAHRMPEHPLRPNLSVGGRIDGTAATEALPSRRPALAAASQMPYTAAVTADAERVLENALKLSDEERAELVVALVQTLVPLDPDPLWNAEIARRIAKVERGEAVLHDAELHTKQLRSKFE